MNDEKDFNWELWTLVVVLISFLTLGFIFTIKAKGATESMPLVDCVKLAEYVKQDLSDLWRRVEPYSGSRARDGVFTSLDYSKAYFEVMKRTSRRVDRTKGVYLELWDRWDYTYREATRYPWNSTSIYNSIELVERDVNYLGSYCYR